MSGLPRAFADGFVNPLLLPAHALTLLALGLFVGQQRTRLLMLVIFAVALAGGLLAIALAVGPTLARSVMLADAVLLGILVAVAWAPPRPLAWLAAAVAGAAVALDSPPQAITIEQGHATLVGTAVGACALLCAVAAVAAHATHGWQWLGLRILGSWIAASAILVLAVMLR